MDFLMELLFGLLFEAPAEALMESKRVKTWVKTTLFLILGLSLSILFGFMSYSVASGESNLSGSCAGWLICIAWTVFVVWMAIRGHKRKWKKSY